MKITIEIECDNEAFGLDAYDASSEVSRILSEGQIRKAFEAADLQRGEAVRHLLDINGNRVGSVRVEP